MARPRRRRLGLLLAVSALLLAADGAAAPGRAAPAGSRPPDGPRVVGSDPAAPAGKVPVVVEHCVLVDHTRRTPDARDPAKPLPSRTIGVELRLVPEQPAPLPGRPAEVHGRRLPARPLLVFAPGYDAAPDLYAPLLNDWARAGFVVAALVFPATNPEAVRAARPLSTEDDIVHQPADVAFAIRTLRAIGAGEDAAGCPAARTLHLSDTVTIAGQSDGASTVAALAYDVHDRPLAAGLGLAAAVVLAGAAWGTGAAGAYRFAPGDPRLLMVQGTADTCNPPQAAVALYDDIRPPTGWFLALRGVGHLPAFVGAAAAGLRAVVSASDRFLGETLPDRAALGASHGAGRSAAIGQAAVGHLRRSLGAAARLSIGPVAPRLAPKRWDLAGCSLRG